MKLLKSEKLLTLIAAILILCHVFLLLQLIFFPYPELFIYSFLTQKGLLPYKEIIDQHFPGLMFLPVNFHTLGIDTLQKMRFVHLSLIIFGDVIFVSVAKKILRKNFLVIISLILYIFWQIYFEGHVLWIESFIAPILLLSFNFLINYKKDGKYFQLILVAITLGVAFLFKQTLLPLVILLFLYLLLTKVPLKRMIVLLSIFLLPIGVAILHFINIGVIKDFIYWTVTFNLTAFNEMGKTQPGLKDLIKLLPTLGIAVAGLLYLLYKKERKEIVIPAIFLLGTLFFAYARYDLIHLQPALPYMILIAVLALKKLGNKKWFWPLLVIYINFSLYIFIPTYRFNNHPGLSPTLNDQETMELVSAINKYHVKGEKIFAAGTYPHIYYLTNTLPPGNIFSFQFSWFMLVNENRIFEGIIKDPPQLVVRDLNSEVGGYKLRDYMKEIYHYIDMNYKLVDRVNNIDILVKI